MSATARQRLRAKQLIAEAISQNKIMSGMDDEYVKSFILLEFITGQEAESGVCGAVIGKYRNQYKVGEYSDAKLGDRTIPFLRHNGVGNQYLYHISVETGTGLETYTFLTKMDRALMLKCYNFKPNKGITYNKIKRSEH